MRLLSYFLTGATSITLTGWGIALTPFAIRAGVYAVVLVLIAIVLAFSLDDPLSEYFGVELPTYYSIVIGIAVAFFSGLGVLAGVLWL